MAHLDFDHLNNVRFGTIFSDIIHPGAGNDFVWAGNGNDVVDDSVSHSFWSIGPGGVLVFNPGIGAGGNDTFHGGNGNDTLRGHTGNDRLYGDSGNDLLDGGIGNDTLIGGSGADTLVGGLGSDTFVYQQTSDSGGFFTNQWDVIQGFDGAGPSIGGDRIDLSAIDAIVGGLNNQFTFWGELTDAQGLAHGAGALWVHDYVGGDTLLHGNTDGSNGNTIELTIRIQDGITDASQYWLGDFLV